MDIRTPADAANLAGIQSDIIRHLRRCASTFSVKGRSGINPYDVMCDMMQRGMYYAYMISRMEAWMRPHPVAPEVTFTVRYTMGRVMLRKMLLEAEAKADVIAHELLPSGMSPLMKTLVVHNYLIDTVAYDYESRENPVRHAYAHSAYGALVRGKCVCQGISDAFKMILERSGVPCQIIYGDANGGKENDWGAHAWNLVSFMKGRYAHIDVTFDLGMRSVDPFRYFLKGASEIQADHRWNPNQYPAADARCSFASTLQRELDENRRALIAAGVPAQLLRLQS